ERYMAAIRMIAKVPTLASFAYRHNMGLPYVYPDNDLSYPGTCLPIMFKKTEARYEPDPRLERALDVLFILHADHEQNCSTNAVRGVGSSGVDPYSAVAAGVAALYGPLHGGANEAVLRMLRRIETADNIPDFLEGVKNREEKLMGFGHRVYKNYDPRARIIKKHVEEVLEATGENPLLDIATELEKPDVFVYDVSIDKLRELDIAFGGRASTVFSSTLAIEEMLPRADLVIGAVLVHGAKAPYVVRRGQLKRMKRNAVLVGVAIDQGRCLGTSHPTTHHD